MQRRFDLSSRLINSAILKPIQELLGRAGFSVTRSVNSLRAKRLEVLRGLGFPTLLDVGANIGQYALELKACGYSGRIVSFEPDPSAYAQLAAASQRQKGEHVYLQMGLGQFDGEAPFRIMKNSACSSFRAPERSAGLVSALFEVEDTAVLPIRRLDSVIPGISRQNERFYLKIDTQGYEREVLLGATETLKRTDAVEVELSLAALYEGQALLPELWGMLSEAGFRPAWIERGYRDPNDIWLLQVDGLFVRGSAWRC